MIVFHQMSDAVKRQLQRILTAIWSTESKQRRTANPDPINHTYWDYLYDL